MLAPILFAFHKTIFVPIPIRVEIDLRNRANRNDWSNAVRVLVTESVHIAFIPTVAVTKRQEDNNEYLHLAVI